ncbi:uncharacterized protein METZ01_LOCUS206488 [marine metagenome]|uniref:Uncharacterized protein n=1 Tax=marine metagenome TaxID=408172 RepID=A0A382ETX2_9ZZZZ
MCGNDVTTSPQKGEIYDISEKNQRAL